MSLSVLKSDIQKVMMRRGAMLVRPAGAGDYTSAGIMQATKVEMTPITTKRDENGQRRQVGGRFQIETSLLQTETVSAMSGIQALATQPLDIILLRTPYLGQTATRAEAEAAGEFLFASQRAQVGAKLDYQRGESLLPMTFGFWIAVSDIDALTL